MNEPMKDLYCPVCKIYPDEISEVYSWAIEKRVWNKDCYELEDVDYGDSHPECPVCSAVLEMKPQEETDDPNPLPEVQGEISEGKGIFPSDEGYQDTGNPKES